MIEAVNIILIIFVLVTAVAATRVRELVSAVFLLGCYSFFLAILWSLLGAPDVSFTEAMVGVGASTIFMLLALFGSKHFVVKQSFGKPQIMAIVLVAVLGVLLIWGSLDLPAFGDALSPASTYLSPYYLQNTLHDSHTPNAVTAVVVDYRSFDTLIETVVIFTAGVACLLVMKAEV